METLGALAVFNSTAEPATGRQFAEASIAARFMARQQARGRAVSIFNRRG